MFIKAPLSLYKISDDKLQELKILDEKKLLENIDSKDINPDKPLNEQLQFNSVNRSNLWDEIYAHYDQVQITSDDLYARIKMMMPKKIEDQGGVSRSEFITGLYSLDELRTYFECLRLSIEQVQQPLYLTRRSFVLWLIYCNGIVQLFHLQIAEISRQASINIQGSALCH